MKKIFVRLSGESYDFTLELCSHYTLIEGIDSGEGKSWLYDTIYADNVEGLVKIDCEYPVVFSDIGNILDSLNRSELSVIFVDEITVSKNNSLRKVLDQCKHFIVSISRDSYFNSAAPLDEIYQVTVNNDQFRLLKYNADFKIPLCTSFDDVDVIVTESSAGKSEYALIEALCKKYERDVELVAAAGKDRIANKLRQITKADPTAKVIVLMDLGNVSSQLRILTKRCRDNKNISFYNWYAFEELLCQSDFILKYGNRVENYSQFSFFSLERYFEFLLAKETEGKPFEYNHNKPIMSSCYWDDCGKCQVCKVDCHNKLAAVLDSKLGKILFEYFSKNVKSKLSRTMSVF